MSQGHGMSLNPGNSRRPNGAVIAAYPAGVNGHASVDLLAAGRATPASAHTGASHTPAYVNLLLSMQSWSLLALYVDSMLYAVMSLFYFNSLATCVSHG